MHSSVSFVQCAAIFAGVLLVGRAARAQDVMEHPWEAGFQVTAIEFRGPAEKPFGLGGRLGRNLNRHLSLEAEASYFPQNQQGNFGETQVVAGMKAGVWLGQWGAFFKVRPGLVHFGGSFFRERNPNIANRFALDIGGVWELNLSSRFAGRMDIGDTMIFYGNALLNDAERIFRPRTDHNLQVSFGVMFRL